MEKILRFFDEQFDKLLAKTTTDVYDALANSAGAFLALLIAVALAYYFIMSACRRSIEIDGILYFVFRSMIIYGVVTGGVIWSSYALPFLNDFGQNVGATVYNGMVADKITDASGFAILLSKFVTQIIGSSMSANAQLASGGWMPTGDEFLGAMLTGISILISVFMIAVAFCLLMATKTVLALALAVAPIFLVWMYFSSTATITQGWIKGLVTIFILQILVFAILGLILSAATELGKEAADTLAALPTESDQKNTFILGNMLQLMLTAMIGSILLLISPFLGTMMAGGTVMFGTSITNSARKQIGFEPIGFDGANRRGGYADNSNDAIGKAGGSRNAAHDAAARHEARVNRTINRLKR